MDCIDSAVFDDRVGVIGVSWHVHVSAHGKVDNDNCFIYDFRQLKQEIRKYLQEQIDHRLLLPTNPNVRYHQGSWQLQSKHGTWVYKCPAEAVCQLSTPTINIDTVAAILQTNLQKSLPHLPLLKISLASDQLTAGQPFHYTHGLPNHEGNCQRLLHGHQGFLQVQSGSQRQPELEKHLVSKVIKHRVHFANSLHTKHDKDMVMISYESKQGHFQANLPSQQCLIIPEQETSIETISQYLATYLRKNYNLQHPTHLTCYEGINKGATVQV